MGAAMFIMFGLTVMFSLPLITAAFARRMGRNPLKWFLIGILLPAIATFILFFLPDLSEEQNKETETK
jgi:Na+/melibiose symporter-like transporter